MEGRKILAEIFDPAEVPEEIRSGTERSGKHPVRSDGKIWLALEDKIFCCDDDPNGNELIRNLVADAQPAREAPRDRKEMLQRILQDPIYIPDPALLKKYRIGPASRGYAAVYRSFTPQAKDLYSILEQTAPLEKGDSLVPLDYRTAAFIRESESLYPDELKEYTEAVIGSLESEGTDGIRAGIGREYTDTESMRRSFRQAEDALSLGMKYQGKSSVFQYTELTFERILECLPAERIREIREESFQGQAAAALSGEMIETVRVFFENDLNLTAASRELFIHRNTLNYRLDKIRRDTGLDLRSFRDAAVFSILYGFPGNHE